MADRVNPPSPEDARRIIAKTIYTGAQRNLITIVPSRPAGSDEPFGPSVQEIAAEVIEALDAAGLRISPKLEDGWREVKLEQADRVTVCNLTINPEAPRAAVDGDPLSPLFEIIDERGEDQT